VSHWLPYHPTGDAPWSLRRVVHLHRRAVFGACRSEIERARTSDPQTAVTRVLDGSVRREGVPADFEQTPEVIGNAAADSGDTVRLRAWWLYRCLYTADPLRERLALMWHNHFATSTLKVNDLRLMKQQNEIFRKHAFSRFGDLIREVTHDPALLIWLDAPSNRAGRPNENLARELLELFTLGVGHFTENDVKQAARALTGWSVRGQKFVPIPDLHDTGPKTILGQSGAWNGDDLLRILLDQPAVAGRLAWRLTNEFFAENVVSDAALNELARGLAEHKLDIHWGVETILRSQLFFSNANLGTRVNDPVSFVLMPLRAFECWNNPPSTLALAEYVSRMGQELFSPPNVGGWSGGRAWLSTRAVVARANYAQALIEGRLSSPVRPIDLTKVVEHRAPASSITDTIRALSELLFGEWQDAVVASVAESVRTVPNAGRLVRNAAVELLRRPEAQLH
jgi:uncharacterized protein (DUF1800 family)